MSIKFVPYVTNPTRLTNRYEVRQLTQDHLPWVGAIMCHSNLFHSTVWTIAYPDNQVQRLHAMMETSRYLLKHQIDSGMSFGIFDNEYKFKRPESAATGGKLYWDANELDTDDATLLEQMDFPLCTVALSYDGINNLDMAQIMPLIETLPLFGTAFQQLEAIYPSDQGLLKATGPKELLKRNGTATRANYEGQGLMKKLAHWLMRQAAENGFSGIQIECNHDAVSHTWLHPPEPFTAELLGTFDTATYTEENEQGEKINPFRGAKQVFTKIFVTLVRFLSHITQSGMLC